jgi:hypothetical protein
MMVNNGSLRWVTLLLLLRFRDNSQTRPRCDCPMLRPSVLARLHVLKLVTSNYVTIRWRMVILLLHPLVTNTFYLVQQGGSWSRNYKSPSPFSPSSPPSSTRFRIFRRLSSLVCPKPTHTQFSKLHLIFKISFYFQNYILFSKLNFIFKIKFYFQN